MRGGACLKEAEQTILEPTRRKSYYAALRAPFDGEADLARSYDCDNVRAACEKRLICIEARLKELTCQFEELRRSCELWAARNDALQVTRIDHGMRSNGSAFNQLLKEQRHWQLVRNRG